MSALLKERLDAALPGRATVANGRTTIAPATVAEATTAVRIARELGERVGVGRGSVALDTNALRELTIDESSLLADVGVGWTVAELEHALGERGLSLGALPALSSTRRLGALLAAPRPSEASPRAGRFSHAIAGVTALIPDGSEMRTLVAPRKAVGPELQQLLIGTRGCLGIILGCTLRVVRRTDTRREAAWEFPGPFAAVRAARALLLDGVRPFDIIVATRPAQLLVSLEGPEPLCEAEDLVISRIAARYDGRPTPHQPLPRYASAPSERFVALDRLSEPSVLHESSRLVGWHLGGAALVDPSRPYAPPAAPSPTVAALKRRLDPNLHLVEYRDEPPGNS